MLHTRVLPFLALASFAVIACTIQKADDDVVPRPSPQPDAGDLGDGGAASSTESDGVAGDASDNPDPSTFLPIRETDDTFRVVMEGTGWNGYHRSCTGITTDSHHSDRARRLVREAQVTARVAVEARLRNTD